MVMWYVRKSFYWLLWLGIIVAILAGRTDAIDTSLDSVESVWDRLGSSLALVVVALLSRIVVRAASLASAYGLARERERALPDRVYFGASIGVVGDRLRVARVYRTLRWTHEVRQIAIARLGGTGRRLSLLDRLIDILNVALAVAIPFLLLLLSRDPAVTGG
jgi:hypothetical protein